LASKPPFPVETEYLWTEYIKIKRGCENIDYVSLQAYENLTGVEFAPWEIDLFIDLDFIRRTNG